MEELQKKIIKLEQNVRELKASQRTQNDSYEFYVYQSENMYSQDWNTLTIEFQPIRKTSDNVICNFFACHGQAVQYVELTYIDPTNPCKASYTVSNDSSTRIASLPSWTRFFHVTCYSNCEGILKITRNT